jgi:hypothetical protein
LINIQYGKNYYTGERLSEICLIPELTLIYPFFGVLEWVEYVVDMDEYARVQGGQYFK